MAEHKLTLAHNELHESVAQSVDFKKLFCDQWATIKAGLQIAAQATSNPIYKVILTSASAVGEAIHTKVCGGGE